MRTITMEKGNRIFTGMLLRFGLVVLLVNFIACKEKKEEVKETAETAEREDLMILRENNSTVAEFVTFVEEDDNKMTLDHEYTNEALHKLIEATRAMADEINYDVKADLDRVKEFADKITRDPFATTHADNIRKSADILTGVLQRMQQANYPELENDVAELKEACAGIKPDVLTLDQKDAVKSFFNKAAEVLKKMN